MTEIGQALQEARERLGLTLEEAERATRIRIHHLRALEAGDFEALSSPVQARGFLKNYADFLGLDADGILLQYADAIQARRPRFGRVAAQPDGSPRPSVRLRTRRPRWLSADLFIASGITLAVLVVLAWGIGRVMAAVGERTRAAVAAVASATPSLTPTSTPPLLEAAELPTVAAAAPSHATVTLPALPIGGAGVNLRLVVEKSAWLSVTVDGREVYRGRVAPGQVLDYQADQQIEVITGNGGGLRAVYNGQDLGTLGDVGEVIIRQWTLQGLATPTATQTRTPTVTPRVTPTPSPTASAAPAAGG